MIAGKGGKPLTPTKPSIKRYNWTVHYTKAAPDCFERNVVYVNGQFQPTIRVTRGQILEAGGCPTTCIAHNPDSTARLGNQASAVSATYRKRNIMRLQVRIKNELPPDYPSPTNGGISIHWHGLSQRGEPWQVPSVADRQHDRLAGTRVSKVLLDGSQAAT